MTKQQFKTKVLNWIKENGIDIKDKRVRVYDTRKYGMEVRIYNEPMELLNTRRSRRMMAEDENGNNCRVGIFKTKITTYTYINEFNLKDEEEMKFTLEMLRNEI